MRAVRFTDHRFLVGLGLVVRGHIDHALLDLGITGDLGELPIVDGELAEGRTRTGRLLMASESSAQSALTKSSSGRSRSPARTTSVRCCGVHPAGDLADSDKRRRVDTNVAHSRFDG